MTSESSLTVYGNRAGFYESKGSVYGVKKISDLEIEVALNMTGEGEVWRSTLRLKLLDSGRTLSFLRTQPPHKEYDRRVRCDA